MGDKNKLLYKNSFIYFLVIVLSTVFIIAGYFICKYEKKSEASDPQMYPAKVTEVYNVIDSSYELEGEGNTVEQKTILFLAKITGKDKKGEVVEAYQRIDGLYYYQPKEVEKGDKILLKNDVNLDTGENDWSYVEHNKLTPIIGLIALFLLLILIIGRRKGVSTIISLVFTAAAIFAVYIPSILKGFNVYLSTIIISVYIVFMSLLILNGADKKTFCAILGNIGGIAIAGILAIIMNKILNITGLMDEDFVYLTLLNEDNPINLQGIIWGSIVIGSLGAIMDVAMSIASSMNELAETMDNKSFSKMLKSGMNIGKDAIGTMTNTLILAYIGGALATVLLLVANNKSLMYLFSLEFIMIEIVQAIVGSIGILVAVPVTAILSARIFNKSDNITETPAET